MPDKKYYNRSEYGNSKYNLGHDNEDLPCNVPKAMETPKVAIPSEATHDKQRNEDGNAGRRARFLKTVKS